MTSLSTIDTADAIRAQLAPPSFKEATKLWARIGLLSFGGPAGQIALMHKELVEERRWIGEQRFLHALNYCMLLPGPEAQQLAIYIGWLLHRTLGGLVAGILFVLPGAFVMLGLSTFYMLYRDAPLIEALFFGVKAAVLAVVVEAVIRIGRRALKNQVMIAIALVAFLAIYVLNVPFPLIVLFAGITGWIGNRLAPAAFSGSAHGKGDAPDFKGAVDLMFERGELAHTRPTRWHAPRTIAIWLPIWLGPVVLIWALTGSSSVWTQLGSFFSLMAVVTFGGAYAVLAYVAQAAVQILRLADARRDGGWPRSRRNHARAAHPRLAVRRVPSSVSKSGRNRSTLSLASSEPF